MSGVAYALALFEIAGAGALMAWVVLTTAEPPATAWIGYIMVGMFVGAILAFAIPALVVARQGTRPRASLVLATIPLCITGATWWFMLPG